MTWIDKYGKPCKIGTIPMVVRVHSSDFKHLKSKVGCWIRVQYTENGNWENVIVRRVDDDLYFQADK